MMLSPEYKERVEHRFNAFCKTVLRNEACNFYKELKRKTQQELSLEYLYEKVHFKLQSVGKSLVALI